MKAIHMWTITACLMPVLAGQTLAQEFMALRAEATVSGDIVRLGDIVDRAGDKADIALFRSPALGAFGTIKAERIAEAARELGVAALDMRGLPSITIHRPSREATGGELADVVLEALKKQDGGLTEARISFDTPFAPLALDRSAPARLTVEIIAYDPKSERFEARITAGRPGAAIKMSGTADTTMSVPTLARNVARGEAIQSSDLIADHRKRRAITQGSFVDAAKLAGLVARKNLTMGDLVKEADVVRPNFVEKNQLVTVVYDTPGLSLSMRGKALTNGTEGTVVNVQNLQTKRTIETVVIGPGRVSARLDQSAPANP